MAKNIVGGVGKVFKSVTGSTLGKALLFGAMIYMGGAALGAWSSPFASINGALAGTEAAAAGEGATAAETTLAAGGEGAADAAGAANVATPAASAPTVADQTASELTASSAGASGASGSPAWQPSATTPNVVTSPGGMNVNVPTGAGRGLISSSMFSQIANNPLIPYAAIQAGAGAVKAAFTPSPAEEAQKALEWRNQFLSPNFNVGAVNVGAPTNQPLRDATGNPVYPRTGIINQAIKR